MRTKIHITFMNRFRWCRISTVHLFIIYHRLRRTVMPILSLHQRSIYMSCCLKKKSGGKEGERRSAKFAKGIILCPRLLISLALILPPIFPPLPSFPDLFIETDNRLLISLVMTTISCKEFRISRTIPTG